MVRKTVMGSFEKKKRKSHELCFCGPPSSRFRAFLGTSLHDTSVCFALAQYHSNSQNQYEYQHFNFLSFNSFFLFLRLWCVATINKNCPYFFFSKVPKRGQRAFQIARKVSHCLVAPLINVNVINCFKLYQAS